MRIKERIPIFLREVDLFDLLHDKWRLFNDKFTVQEVVTSIKVRIQEVSDFWMENPDLRFSQVLVNMGFIPNAPGCWYYMEERTILQLQGVPHRKIFLWGSNLDKKGKYMKETIWKPICELDTDHIENILKNCRMTNLYADLFKAELKLREQVNLFNMEQELDIPYKDRHYKTKQNDK